MDKSPTKNRQAGAIEVTPEMIEAGEEVLGLYDRELDSRGETIVAIFTAMIQASRVRPDTGV